MSACGTSTPTAPSCGCAANSAAEPAGTTVTSSCSCATTTAPDPGVTGDVRTMTVQLLAFGPDVCDRCSDTVGNLDGALALAGSPTIRIDGQEVPAAADTRCASCSQLAEAPTSCRTWTWRGATYGAPPGGMLVEAVLAAVVAADDTPQARETADVGDFDVPATIRPFPTGKE